MQPEFSAKRPSLKMRTALLIGGSGFVGRHMQRSLLPSFKVIATDRTADIRDFVKIEKLVKTATPDIVINFASVTTVRESFQDPLDTYRIGFIGTLNLLMALKESGFKGRMLNISSSEAYGHPSSDLLPVKEEVFLRPMSPYAVSKVATEALCYQWSQTEQFEIVTARPFTHIGPGQSDRFAISHFARQLAEISLAKRAAVIHVGNLHATRDITDVRDVVRAYCLLLDRGQNGQAYNICSGREVNIKTLLNEFIELTGLDVSIEHDDSLMRNVEQKRIYGSHEKIRNEVGWYPQIPLKQTLLDTFSFWKDKLI
jgi:GDP-4-dehydro-6-deoxy-D-mannose reductase